MVRRKSCVSYVSDVHQGQRPITSSIQACDWLGASLTSCFNACKWVKSQGSIGSPSATSGRISTARRRATLPIIMVVTAACCANGDAAVCRVFHVPRKIVERMQWRAIENMGGNRCCVRDCVFHPRKVEILAGSNLNLKMSDDKSRR